MTPRPTTSTPPARGTAALPAQNLSVPLEVEAKAASTWGQAH